MARRVDWRLLSLLLTGFAVGQSRALWAQTAAAPAAAAQAANSSAVDEDAQPVPAEPDFVLIDLPTTLRLPLHRGNFRLTHRWEGNLRGRSLRENARDLFGLDNGAAIGLEFRYAIARHVQAVIYRTNIDKALQVYGKYDPIRQSASMPVSLSALVSVEGSNNFRKRRLPALGGVVSRTINDTAAIYATPIWAHNTAAEAGLDRDTFVLGMGGRVRVRTGTYVVGEVSPRLAGYQPGKPEFGFAIEKRIGGHVFQLNVSNALATTFGQIARGGYPKTLYMGFNLSRKFY